MLPAPDCARVMRELVVAGVPILFPGWGVAFSARFYEKAPEATHMRPSGRPSGGKYGCSELDAAVQGAGSFPAHPSFMF